MGCIYAGLLMEHLDINEVLARIYILEVYSMCGKDEEMDITSKLLTKVFSTNVRIAT